MATATKTPARKRAAKSAARTTAKSPAKTPAKSSAKSPGGTTARPAGTTAGTVTDAPAAPPAAEAAARRAPAVTADTGAAVAGPDKSAAATPELRKADFIDAVVARSGLKKREVKPAVEAAMALLGEAIEAGREISFPELGKLKVNREKDLAGAKVIICKLRRPKPAAAGSDAGSAPLAEDGD